MNQDTLSNAATLHQLEAELRDVVARIQACLGAGETGGAVDRPLLRALLPQLFELLRPYLIEATTSWLHLPAADDDGLLLNLFNNLYQAVPSLQLASHESPLLCLLNVAIGAPVAWLAAYDLPQPIAQPHTSPATPGRVGVEAADADGAELSRDGFDALGNGVCSMYPECSLLQRTHSALYQAIAELRERLRAQGGQLDLKERLAESSLHQTSQQLIARTRQYLQEGGGLPATLGPASL